MKDKDYGKSGDTGGRADLTGVAGYVASTDVSSLSAREGTVAIRFEPGSDKVVFRVPRSEIQRVIPGSTSGGETFVQVILNPGTHVETQIQMLKDVRNLSDPGLFRLTAAAVSSVSSIGGSE